MPSDRRLRERLVAALEPGLQPLAAAVGRRLMELVEKSASSREANERRDAALQFERLAPAWIAATHQAWLRAASGAAAPASAGASGGPLSLIDHDVVEQKIIASRLALSLQEHAGWELNDLHLRMQHLELVELAAQDLLRPEGLALHLVNAWMDSGLPRRSWLLAGDAVQQQLGPALLQAYQGLNELLVAQGVLPDIDLSRRVRRSAESSAARADGAPLAAAGIASGGSGGSAWGRVPDDAAGAPDPFPLARMSARAQGVLGQVRRLLGERVSGYQPDQPVAPSMNLASALVQHDSTLRIDPQAFASVDVVQAGRLLREQTGELKRLASLPSEKALIEVVALMFQSILAEERIPPSVRVWFARLQMPALRVALAEPEFFDSLQHPARLLIDRMGSCVLGFDAASIDGSEMESEIRRVVQMIEQYPETGRQVFVLAHEEFQAFLSRYLVDQEPARRLVSVAQQVEQKDTLAVRYTIELRKLLDDMPVPDTVREFLFKIWAEVMALAAVRQGVQHADTVALQRLAAELVWACAAKPNRTERAQVIQGLARLLQQLRQGMTLLGMTALQQEVQIKRISDILADAFQSKTAVIPTARIEAIAERLENLESVVGEATHDLTLDAESLALLLGEDARALELVTGGGMRPGAAAQAWARELQPGAWFRLDHNGAAEPVQYVWRSEGRHLHLFMARRGRCVLFQAGRLAGYLQAGLMVPGEDESLTVRATRDALAKLDANPERLLV